MMDRLRQDLVVSFRRLRKSPGFTAAAIVTLALGIGANATIFSVVNAIVLRPLAVHNPDELVFLNTRLSNKEEFPTQSYPNYRDYRDQNQSLAGLAAYRFVPISISRSGTNARLWGYEVTGNYFDMLGVQPAAGRLLHADDDVKFGAHPVAVLGYGCWQKRFGGDPGIVGNPVKLNGLEYVVVGVTPPDFFGTELIYTPDIYLPIAMQRQIEPGFEWIEERSAGNIFVVGRLKPGVTTAQAEANLSSVAARLAQTYPKDNGGMGISLSRPGLVGSYLRGAVTGFAAVLMTVAQNEGLSQTGLVDRTGIDRSTLADIVRRMQRKGLLQRRRTKEDARAYAVKLTDEGRRVLRISEPLAKRVDERILDALPTKQRDQFIDDLLSIIDTLQKLSAGQKA
jgi:DNA-binding MarR family transcriptional regulator